MRIIWLFTLILFTFSCTDKKNIPDISDVTVNFELFRTEKMFFSPTSKETMIDALQGVRNNHPAFYNLYFRQVFPVGPVTNSDSLADAILEFKKQPLSDTMLTLVNTAFPDIEPVKKDLEKAFRYAKYYFPEKTTPDVYTLVSEYAYQAFIFEGRGGKDALGIGLDMFLGNSFDYKKLEPDNPGFSHYITRSWNKDHLVKKALEVWVSDFVEPVPGNKLLDQMIYYGKKIYTLAQFMPETPDSVLFEYTGESATWCQNNELEMWSFFIEKNLLESSSPMEINKYINQSPDSPGMPVEAPGRTGHFIGYKIVEAYMKKNKEVTLEDLAKETDVQKIYKLSKYKPRRK